MKYGLVFIIYAYIISSILDKIYLFYKVFSASRGEGGRINYPKEKQRC